MSKKLKRRLKRAEAMIALLDVRTVGMNQSIGQALLRVQGYSESLSHMQTQLANKADRRPKKVVG